MAIKFQRLDEFVMPPGFRGASAVRVQFWWMIQATLFRWSPQIAYPFRRFLLRAFGAHIGRGVLIRPTATVTYPWKIEIGEYAWIGDDVTLYSLGRIKIGPHAVISQKSYVCGGDHDYSKVDFPIRSADISIEAEAWIATDVFIAPGVNIGRACVVGARSSVFSDLPAETVCVGSPCRVIKARYSE